MDLITIYLIVATAVGAGTVGAVVAWTVGRRSTAQRLERMRALGSAKATLTKQRAEAREIRREDRFLKRLEKTDPVAYKEYMGLRLGIGREDRLTEALDLVERIKGSGLMGDGDSDPVMQKLLMTVGMAFAAKMMPNVGGPAEAPPQPTRTDPPTIETPSVQQLPQRNDLVTTFPIAVGTNGAHPRPGISSKMPKGLKGMSSIFLVTHLAGKTPEQAAEWLLTQKEFPAFAEVLEVIVRTPDEELPEWLDQLGRDNPELRDFVNWISPQLDWFLETIQTIRAQVQSGG